MIDSRKIVIIGGGAGGGTAAQFARKTDRKAKITIFEKGKYPQYSKCGLPYIISGRIPNAMDLIEFNEDWFRKANIELKLETKVEKIDIENKKIYAKDKKRTLEESFDSLILCTGAKPIIPPIENIFENNSLVGGVFTIRTIDDIKKIKSNIEKVENVTIVGAGLIGLEMADNLEKIGKNVNIVEALPYILANNLDQDIAEMVFNEISKKIKIDVDHLCKSVKTEDSKVKKVILRNNKTGREKIIDCDMLILAVGVKPEIDLAKKIGCKIGTTGRIKVDDKSMTNLKDVFAVGDCTEYVDFVKKEPVCVGLGSIVVRQGIEAGINASGGNYNITNGFLLTSTSDFFGIEIASVGLSSIQLDNKKLVSAKFKGSSLPEYFPGGKPIVLKVLVDGKNGRIVGAQAIGDKAAKRIDLFACAILNHSDVNSFRKLETAYAPPIAPTLDAETLVCDIISTKLARKK